MSDRGRSNVFTRMFHDTGQDPSVYFVGKSLRVFISMAVIVATATGAFFLDDHSHHAFGEGKGDLCISGLLLTVVTGLSVFMSFSVLLARLYFTLWKGRGLTPVLIIQAGLLLPIFLAVFTRVFSLPMYLMPKDGNASIAISNLIFLVGFLFAGQATYKLIHLVNANFKA